jgi:hypothetical protein
MKLCKDCRYYQPDNTFLVSNPRWAECLHPSSLEPPGKPSVVDGSVPKQLQLRCVEARAGLSGLYPDRVVCGPEARFFEPK